jgi:hypothetical protein
MNRDGSKLSNSLGTQTIHLWVQIRVKKIFHMQIHSTFWKRKRRMTEKEMFNPDGGIKSINVDNN